MPSPATSTDIVVAFRRDLDAAVTDAMSHLTAGIAEAVAKAEQAVAALAGQAADTEGALKRTAAESEPERKARYVRAPELAAELGISVATLHKWAKTRPNGMPPRIKMGPRVFMWDRTEIAVWIVRCRDGAGAAGAC